MAETVGIPVTEYEMMNGSAACTPTAEAALRVFLGTVPYERIILFGGSVTGKLVKGCLGERFARFVDSATLADCEPDEGDCVIITTGPLHVPGVEASIKDSSLKHLPVFRLFQSDDLDIRFVLETQPRCGTYYSVRNLRRSLNLGFGTTFSLTDGESTSDGLIHYRPEETDGYLVKTHFTKPLHYPQYRYLPTIFLIGYFYDTYYRWARMVAEVPAEKRQSYFLSADAPEWAWVKGYIPLHLQWLEYVKDKDYIRYEDYFNDFEGVMDVYERVAGERPVGFEQPRKISDRMYWTDSRSMMDEPVWRELQSAFKEHVAFFYPEKSR